MCPPAVAETARVDDAHRDALLWHYTVSKRLIEILATGVLRRSTTGLPKGERAGVWFTPRIGCEPTATRWVRASDEQFRAATMAEMAASGCARLGVRPDVARTTWAQHRCFGGLTWADGEAVERHARQQASDPDVWRASYKDVPQAQWVRIETSADGVTWTAHPGG